MEVNNNSSLHILILWYKLIEWQKLSKALHTPTILSMVDWESLGSAMSEIGQIVCRIIGIGKVVCRINRRQRRNDFRKKKNFIAEKLWYLSYGKFGSSRLNLDR